MLGLNEIMDRLALANSVHWYGYVLSREDCHVLRKVLDFWVECQRKKGGQRGHEKSRLWKNVLRLV